MIPVKKIGEKVAGYGARKVESVKTFHSAYKAEPSETLGKYAQRNKWGVGLTAASMIPIHTGVKAGTRRSSHQGINQKGGM